MQIFKTFYDSYENYYSIIGQSTILKWYVRKKSVT